MPDHPWLTVPAADYEGHMGAAGVDQLAPLRTIFADVYARVHPARMALLGCCTGNGLDVIDTEHTRRVVAVDLNPDYLAVARQRHPRLESITAWTCADLARCELDADGFDLIHAALLFEYTDPAPLLPRIARWLAPGGVLSIVVQLPGGDASISDTGFASLQALQGLMRLVSPAELRELAARADLTEAASTIVPLARGKSFWAATFTRPG